MKLKGRIGVHRNRDADTHQVISDCAAADMAVIRLLLYIWTCLGFKFGAADIKGVYMHSRNITREVYVRPRREFLRKRGVILRLLKLPFGLLSAGRERSTNIEGWMHLESKMEKIFGVPQMFIKRTGMEIELMVAKVTEKFLVEGNKDHIKSLMREIQPQFSVGK